MSAPRRSTDVPPRLGVTLDVDGAWVAVFARHATAVDLCLFDAEGREHRVPLTHTAYGIWWDHVPGMGPGQRYGYRAHGPWSPTDGHRHNPAKLLLDPYAGALDGQVRWGPEVYGHTVDEQWSGDGEVPDGRDSSAYVPRSVVVDHSFDWGQDVRPEVPWSQTVVYEAHVRGLTMRHPDVPEELRGTYAALGHPAILDHLTGLGVTTLELLPVHAFTHEPRLVQLGLSNYWGYNTLGFFAPHAPYAVSRDPQGVVEEVKGAVRALHAAGIEVVLDVVYNHTAEQGADSGATLSWRGLDNATYYRLDERGRDIDVTGCGNTVDLRRPMVAKMALDSLRHWVTEYHVDGFRFDLAPALARGRDDAYDPDHAFHVALRTDPVLSRVKLIAEPWDIGVHGWRTGQFPPPFAEWNDRFRDTVRTFWLADSARGAAGQTRHGIGELATRITGSEDMFALEDRGPIASVNYVTAHDGFTLADTTAYEEKHNEANGEDNRDGHGDNRSWNHGVEGPTQDPEVLAARRRSVRNLLATTLFSAGVPMLTAGDEIGRTQGGNNNAYCQDNETSWVDWEVSAEAEDLRATVAALTALRREHRALRPVDFPRFDPEPGRARVRWFAPEGHVLSPAEWADPARCTVVALLEDSNGEDDAVLLVLHSGASQITVRLPEVEGLTGAQVLWDSTWERPGEAVTDDIEGVDEAPTGEGANTFLVAPRSTLLLRPHGLGAPSGPGIAGSELDSVHNASIRDD
ncbi:glycogen debranching protein GlgX [Ornithinicoccus hortensis]|uniref:Glycogen operon protein n=1 Tax=Ornithinicoccus hortensis TaxID=82346 RepID=A0A542YV31_9MICO|nr:glycogen debranching protein GlgX [Ornithinicoccus hortensis]TQL51946.1 glycogen operon protein [Ornithinicoccus hortensis]